MVFSKNGKNLLIDALRDINNMTPISARINLREIAEAIETKREINIPEVDLDRVGAISENVRISIAHLKIILVIQARILSLLKIKDIETAKDELLDLSTEVGKLPRSSKVRGLQRKLTETRKDLEFRARQSNPGKRMGRNGEYVNKKARSNRRQRPSDVVQGTRQRASKAVTRGDSTNSDRTLNRREDIEAEMNRIIENKTYGLVYKLKLLEDLVKNYELDQAEIAKILAELNSVLPEHREEFSEDLFAFYQRLAEPIFTRKKQTKDREMLANMLIGLGSIQGEIEEPNAESFETNASSDLDNILDWFYKKISNLEYIDSRVIAKSLMGLFPHRENPKAAKIIDYLFGQIPQDLEEARDSKIKLLTAEMLRVYAYYNRTAPKIRRSKPSYQLSRLGGDTVNLVKNSKLFQMVNIHFGTKHLDGVINGFTMDYYIPQLKLNIEVFGNQENNQDELQFKDLRDAYIEKQGVKVLRVSPFNEKGVISPEEILIAIVEAVQARNNEITKDRLDERALSMVLADYEEASTDNIIPWQAKESKPKKKRKPTEAKKPSHKRAKKLKAREARKAGAKLEEPAWRKAANEADDKILLLFRSYEQETWEDDMYALLNSPRLQHLSLEAGVSYLMNLSQIPDGVIQRRAEIIEALVETIVTKLERIGTNGMNARLLPRAAKGAQALNVGSMASQRLIEWLHSTVLAKPSILRNKQGVIGLTLSTLYRHRNTEAGQALITCIYETYLEEKIEKITDLKLARAFHYYGWNLMPIDYKRKAAPSNIERGVQGELKRAGFVSKLGIQFNQFVFDHEIDIFLPEQKVIIELDGEPHYNAAKRRKDAQMVDFFATKGYKVFRIRSENLSDVLDEVLDILEKVETTQDEKNEVSRGGMRGSRRRRKPDNPDKDTGTLLSRNPHQALKHNVEVIYGETNFESWQSKMIILTQELREANKPCLRSLVSIINKLELIPTERALEGQTEIEELLEGVLSRLSAKASGNINMSHIGRILDGLQILNSDSRILEEFLLWIEGTMLAWDNETEEEFEEFALPDEASDIKENKENSAWNVNQSYLGKALNGLYFHRANPIAQRVIEIIAAKVSPGEGLIINNESLLRAAHLLNLDIKAGDINSAYKKAFMYHIEQALTENGTAASYSLEFNQYVEGIKCDVFCPNNRTRYQIVTSKSPSASKQRRAQTDIKYLEEKGVYTVQITVPTIAKEGSLKKLDQARLMAEKIAKDIESSAPRNPSIHYL